MKSLHFFIGVFIFNFIFSTNIFSADSENQNSVQEFTKTESCIISNSSQDQDYSDAHRATPLSPKKTNKAFPLTFISQLIQDHGVTPLDHRVTPISPKKEHGTTPVKENSEIELSIDKENINLENQLTRTESMSLRYSYSNGNLVSCNSFGNLYALATANITPSSPKNNGSLKGRATLFPLHCNTLQETSSAQAR